MCVFRSMIKEATLVFIILLSTSISVYTQVVRITGDPVPKTSYDNILQGRIYFPIYPSVQGSQYLMNNWSLGHVFLQGRWYTDLPLLYDIYVDDLIYLAMRDQSFDFIRLVKDYIQEFHLGDRQFINLTHSAYSKTDLAEGFYEVQVEGKVTYLIKRKNLFRTEQAISSFYRKDLHYLVYKGQAYRMQNKKSLLPLIGKEKKKAVFSFLKKERIRLKKSGDEGWRKVALYLNTIQLD